MSGRRMPNTRYIVRSGVIVPPHGHLIARGGCPPGEQRLRCGASSWVKTSTLNTEVMMLKSIGRLHGTLKRVLEEAGQPVDSDRQARRD